MKLFHGLIAEATAAQTHRDMLKRQALEPNFSSLIMAAFDEAVTESTIQSYF